MLGRTRRRVPATLLLLAPLTVAGLPRSAGAAHPGWPAPPPRPEEAAAIAPVTGFGGYHVQVPSVDQLGASWAVPAIAPSSRPGSASTWIGAQNVHGPPFVQIGTVEQLATASAPTYELFWSDPAVGFHAQPLGPVTAGAVVRASLRRVGARWTAQLTDVTTGTTVTRVLAGAAGGYDQAEWFQEDPALLGSGQDVPYPSLSDVTFTDLTVNGADPVLTLADGVTLMSDRGGDFVPTPVTGDTFALLPPTGYARRYLLLAGAIDRVLNRFNALSATWPRLPPATRLRVAAQLAAAYAHFDQRLAGHTWPSTAQPALHWLVARGGVIHWALERWIEAGAPPGGPTLTRLRTAWATDAASAARSALGLPPA
ncbi:MAG: hypothetical protein M0T71_06780 [Actinomycetota bacterium]|nr:hypothetical protein [Actinomycetota bacterium]